MNDLIFGKTWDEIQAMQQGTYRAPRYVVGDSGDYGADPLGDGMFRMIPSGDVVDYAERCKRLGH
jgi:hypothetical protein